MHRLERRYILASLSTLKSQIEVLERLVLAGAQAEEPTSEPASVSEQGRATLPDERAEAQVGQIFEELTQGVKIVEEHTLWDKGEV